RGQLQTALQLLHIEIVDVEAGDLRLHDRKILVLFLHPLSSFLKALAAAYRTRRSRSLLIAYQLFLEHLGAPQMTLVGLRGGRSEALRESVAVIGGQLS